MVTVHFDTSDLKALADPQLIARAEAEMIDVGVDILVPITRREAPTRTGKGRGQITGSVFSGAKRFGRVHVGKAFYLRILATGAKAHSIGVFRYKSKSKARKAARALGPGGARGSVQALRFSVGGEMLFRPGVRHPGIKSNDFFERSARLGEAPVGRAAEAVAQRALDRATHG
jgi:hypothetical protein